MKNILITGGSGLIGTRLTELLIQTGYSITHLSRAKREHPVKSFTWDVSRHNLESGSLANIDVIIHLAGAGIADEAWTHSRKKVILDSRVDSTRLLFNELKKGNHRVTTFIAASAIGFYGLDDRQEACTEQDEAGDDFLASVTERWEAEVDLIASLGIRVVKIRTGIVLSKTGGALEEIMRPVKYYVGAPLGTGDQPVSWIHIDDLCGIYAMAITNQNIVGVLNGVAPAPITNRDFTRAIAKVLGRPLLLPPIPRFAIRLLLGEMASLVLNGTRVSAQKILEVGFKFDFPTIESALNDLIKDT